MQWQIRGCDKEPRAKRVRDIKPTRKLLNGSEPESSGVARKENGKKF